MIDRTLAHDLRGVIAAAASNIEYARTQSLPEDVVAALNESANELRVASDVIALLGAQSERVLEIDLRAAILVHRAESAIAVDATQAPFLLNATAGAIAALGKHLAALAPRGRLKTEPAQCTLAPVDGVPATAVLSAANLDGSLTDGTLSLRPRGND
jgi:hypothetical protein